ncbi:MAG: cellulase family glycosylhydrolase [Lachnospiraceae bacterium]|nr:cellulase family glycosylhydrolase [Lachnospiraceae bacterium]
MKKIWKAAVLIFAACLVAVGGCGSGNVKETGQNEIETEKGQEERESAQETTGARSLEETENPAGTAENPSAGQVTDDTGKTPAAPSTCGALRVNGTMLVDENGKPVQLRGISTHGLAWFPAYVNEDCFRQLRKEWDVNVIRLAMYTAESGGYCSDGNKEELKALVERGVEYAVEQDMYVIIDWHILSDGNPNQHIEEAKAFFREMSEKYKDCDNVIYEICNEPNGNVDWGEIKTYGSEVIAVIREQDPDGVILVGTPNWSQMVDQAAADPITGYDNVMYTLHFYAATHTDWLRDTMKKAIDGGLPVFVSEYGICDASGNGSIDVDQADAWIQAMDEYGVSYVAWNLSNKAETSAILKESCSKTSGFSSGDLSESGKWLYQMLTGESSAGDERPEEGIEKDAEKEPERSGEEIQAAGRIQGEGVNCQAELKNTWEADGQVFCQYALTVSNSSETEMDGWSVSLTFQEEISLSDGWNGEYKVEGNTLTVSAVDYNRKIPAGGTVSDVGFIVGGVEKPAIAF